VWTNASASSVNLAFLTRSGAQRRPSTQERTAVVRSPIVLGAPPRVRRLPLGRVPRLAVCRRSIRSRLMRPSGPKSAAPILSVGLGLSGGRRSLPSSPSRPLLWIQSSWLKLTGEFCRRLNGRLDQRIRLALVIMHAVLRLARMAHGMSGRSQCCIRVLARLEKCNE
jgi:hypothetical protein